MRLLFIRHGDPDYVHDTLTEKGHREAALLAERAEALQMGECFVSPLGRAQATAGYSMKKLGRTAKTQGWLQEFPASTDLNEAPHLLEAFPTTRMEDGKYVPRIVWDIAPAYWSVQSECMDPAHWRDCDICRNSDTVEIYDHVTGEFDRLLAEHGYVRDGMCYRVEKESTDTLTFFCHFGITCVFLAHLWNTSPVPALAQPCAGAHVCDGSGYGRTETGARLLPGLKIGDVSHLVLGGEPVSTAARFCETFSGEGIH